jgi:hypothetical protein
MRPVLLLAGAALFTVLCPASSLRGERGDRPTLVSDPATGLVVLEEERYEGSALYGYIDGGADLYYEYGFLGLTVQEVALQAETLTVEVWEFHSAEGALGLFTATDAGRTRAVHRPFFSTSPHQSSGTSSRFVVRAVNERGSASAAMVSERLAGSLLDRVPAPLPLSPLLCDTAFSAALQGLRRSFGPLGVQNTEPGWTEMLDGLDSLATTSVRVGSGDEGCLVVELHGRDAAKALRQFQTARAPGREQRGYREKAGDGLLYIERPAGPKECAGVEAALDRYAVRLP